MSTEIAETQKLTIDQRYSANGQLNDLLVKGGVKTRLWKSEAKGSKEAGTGVSIYNSAGDQVALMTVAGNGKLYVRSVLESLDLADPVVDAIVKAIPEKYGINKGKFIPDPSGLNGPKPVRSYGAATFFKV